MRLFLIYGYNLISYPPLAVVFTISLQVHQVWIHRILPPIVDHTAGPPGNFGQMVQPPFVENVHIPIAPFIRVDLANIILKDREIVPIIAIACHFAGIVVIVVDISIGWKMDISDLGLSGCHFVIKSKLGIQVVSSLCFRERLGHNGFDTVAKRMEHFPHSPFGGKAHYDKSPAATSGPNLGLGIAPESAHSAHGRFIETGLRKAEQPNLVNFASGDARDDIQAGQDGLVVGIFRLVGWLRFIDYRQIRLCIVSKPIG